MKNGTTTSSRNAADQSLFERHRAYPSRKHSWARRCDAPALAGCAHAVSGHVAAVHIGAFLRRGNPDPRMSLVGHSRHSRHPDVCGSPPRADIRPMPAFMSTRHRAHIVARVVSDARTTPTIRTRQQHSGRPDGLHCCSTSLSEHCLSHTSIACGLSQLQQGSCVRSVGIGLLNLNQRTAALVEAAGDEPMPAVSGFHCLRTAHAWSHGPTRRRSWRRVRATARPGPECEPRELRD